MSTVSDQTEEMERKVLYTEAEIASLKEELEAGNGVLQKRKEFVCLRIALLEKSLPEMISTAKRAREHLNWLARLG